MVLSESPVDQPNSSPRCGPERTMGSGCATESHRQGQDAGVSSCSSRRTMIGNHVHRGKRLPALCATIRRHDSNERTSATTLFPLTPERGLLDPSRRRRVASGGLITAEQARSLIVHSDTFSALVRRMNTPSTRNPRTVRGGSSRSCGTCGRPLRRRLAGSMLSITWIDAAVASSCLAMIHGWGVAFRSVHDALGCDDATAGRRGILDTRVRRGVQIATSSPSHPAECRPTTGAPVGRSELGSAQRPPRRSRGACETEAQSSRNWAPEGRTR